MVADHGYPIEKYFYTTSDNYINCVFRISGRKGTKSWDNHKLYLLDPAATRKPVIIYQHGFCDSAATICTDGPSSLAFFLAD